MKKQSKNNYLFFQKGLVKRTLNIFDAANLAHVHYKTAQRWANGTQEPHPAVKELLYLKATGRVLPDCFDEVYCDDTHIIAPQGAYGQNILLSHFYLLSCIDFLKQENHNLKLKLSMFASSVNF